MNSIDLYKLKNNTKCLFLSDDVIQEITDSFSKSNIKTVKCVKKQINMIKSNKIQAKKDLNENKIIMIMNKISNNNINELLIDYIHNILIENEDNYNSIINEIFNKMIKDIKFIDNYIHFTIKIFTIEKHRLNLLPNRFIELINEFMKSEEEAERAGCFEIIKKLQKYNFFNNIDFISDKLLEECLKTDLKYIDIYNWFNNQSINKYKDQIIRIINRCKELSLNREKILIESLIENKDLTSESLLPEVDDDINQKLFLTSVENIIEEYKYIKSSDEIIEFINTDCKNINEKNILCKELINHFIDEITICLELFEVLIRKKVLFKSNISKGLILFLNENDSISNSKIITILNFLKNNNITKNIEYLFKKYKIKLFYD